jgi:hypothetical protein
MVTLYREISMTACSLNFSGRPRRNAEEEEEEEEEKK